MGRNDGHQRGVSVAAYGELSMATVICKGFGRRNGLAARLRRSGSVLGTASGRLALPQHSIVEPIVSSPHGSTRTLPAPTQRLAFRALRGGSASRPERTDFRGWLVTSARRFPAICLAPGGVWLPVRRLASAAPADTAEAPPECSPRGRERALDELAPGPSGRCPFSIGIAAGDQVPWPQRRRSAYILQALSCLNPWNMPPRSWAA